MSPSIATGSTAPPCDATTSPTPLSSSSRSSRRHTSRTATLLLSLTIACCFLASSASTLTFASPVPKIANQQRQQRSLQQQVHQVQIADESVHNSMVLMKKSIQKRKQQTEKLKQQQKQHIEQRPKQKKSQDKKKSSHLQKRQKSAETKSTVGEATVNSRPADDGFVTVGGSSTGSASIDRAINGKKEDVTRREDTIVDSNRSNKSNKSQSTTTTSHAIASSRKSVRDKKSQNHSKTNHAKLISAYEAIVFSESQIPVFLSQDHHGRQLRKPKALTKMQHETSKLTSEASADKLLLVRKQLDIASNGQGDALDSVPELEAAGQGKQNRGKGQGQGQGQGVTSTPKSDKNRSARLELVPAPVSVDAREQMEGQEQGEHLPPITGAAPLGHEYTQQSRLHFTAESNSAFVYIYGAIAAIVLVGYRLYSRSQRQRRVAALSLSVNSSSDKVSLSL
ncbi:hypothetical protein BGX28_002412 [Mortierella sp. GBA30]|nr:hypothetical protein BGX28_002412 [Mortierella sp. GBA30]